MIVSFETKNSETLDRFINNFLDPKSVWTQLIHSYSYTNKEVTRIGDMTIIEMESIMDIIMRTMIILSVCAVFTAYILALPVWLGISALTLILAIISSSKVIRQLLMKWELKRGGHKEPIRFLSYTETIERTLYEYKTTLEEHSKCPK